VSIQKIGTTCNLLGRVHIREERALNNPTVQKIIAVSDEKQLKTKEIKSLPENLKVFGILGCL
jgi:hypothetical protein